VRPVTASVKLAASVRIANVWLLSDGVRAFLVDTTHQPGTSSSGCRRSWRERATAGCRL
jgi:hypothetical protein